MYNNDVILVVFMLLLFSPSWLSMRPHGLTVDHLPGFDGPLPFHLETGYVEVDEMNGVQIFYYFIKSERKPEEDPLLVWLTGGPGCSGLSGLALEIGPIKFDVHGYNGGLPNLIYHPYSWTKVSSIIFLDSPVGTGFSYSRRAQGYETGATKSAIDVSTFIRKWLVDHQEFLSNPLYIGGDSWSGMIVPLVAQEIANGNQASTQAHFNLKGYLVGNPSSDTEFDGGASVPFAHGMGLISDELYQSAKENCGGKYFNPSNAECANSLQLIDECLEGINVAHILEPVCDIASPKPNKVNMELLEYYDRRVLLSNSLLQTECRSSEYMLLHSWTNNDTVRNALGIHKGTVKDWKRCKFDLPYVYDVLSCVSYHRNLTTRGYRALVYSGDHDMLVPFVGTEAWIKSLNFSIVDEWRSWSANGQVAGFTRTYEFNLTFATVKGGGHTAPEYKPKECQAMFGRWISGVPL